MCELLGMSANIPTDICFSFSGLMQRGGKTGPHKDGWGIAFYEGKGCRVFHDPDPSAQSEIAKLIKRYPIHSQQVICHIRKANSGKVCLENTHPFIKTLWGRYWTFAHNGQLKGIKKAFKLNEFIPVGTTDSEFAFCWLLSEIKKKFPKPPKNEKALWVLIEKLVQKIHEFGIFNFLLSDGKYLYAHCSTKLYWTIRKAPFGKVHLVDDELEVDFHQIQSPKDVIAVIATQPLTHNEVWKKGERGNLLVFRDGQIIHQNF